MRIKTLLILPALIGIAASAPGPKLLTKPIPLSFGVKDGATPKHPALVGTSDEGPCGAEATLNVTSVPRFKPAEPFTNQTATEIDSKGKTLRSWPLPSDYVVSSLDGDWLLTSYAGKADPIWVHTSGKIGVASAADSAIALGDDGVMLTTSCPANDDRQCLSVRDRPARSRRTIVAPGVCS